MISADDNPPEKLEGDAQVVSEVEVLLHVNDVVAVISVSSPHRVQDLQLDEGLMVEPERQHQNNVFTTVFYVNYKLMFVIYMLLASPNSILMDELAF